MLPITPYARAHQRPALLLISTVLLCLVACTNQGHLGSAAGITPTPHATSTVAATPVPRQTPDPLDRAVHRYVSGMSLDAKIGQLIFAQSYSDGIYQDPTSTIIRKFQPGGLIIYQFELQSAPQAKTYFQHIQADSHIPVLIGTDNEGGGEWRLSNIYPATPPSAFAIGATNDTQYAYDQGAAMAAVNLALGMNIDLAPVVDVHPGGQSRDFGTTPDQVTKMAGAWMRGLQDNGMIATLKHFPGLGGTYEDPHAGLPVVNHSRDVIEQMDLAPYRNLLNSGNVPGVIMSTDILMTTVDAKVPAELSYPIMTGLLRDELHYDGVVMTDALYMGGIGQYMCEVDQVANCDKTTYARNNPQVLARLGVMALQAGNDMLLGSWNVQNTQAMINGIKDALQRGTLTMARIDQSVTRIISLKVRRGLLAIPEFSTPGGPQPHLSVGDAMIRVRADS